MHRISESNQRWLLAIGICIVGCGMSWSLFSEHTRIDNSERTRLATQARIVDENLQHQLEAVNNALVMLQNDLPEILSEKNGLHHLNHQLSSLSGALPGVRTLYVLNSKGIVTASNREGLIGLDAHEREYFNIARQSNNPAVLHVSSPIRNAMGTYAINLEKSTSDRQGRFAGLVAATLDPDYFTTLLSSVNYEPDMWTSLVHADGTLFLIVPDQKIGSGNKLEKPNSMFSRHMASSQTATIMTGRILATGEERIAARRTVRLTGVAMDQPLVIAVTRNLAAIFSAWHDEVVRQAGWFLFLMLFSGGGLILIQKRQRKFAHIEALREQESVRYQSILKTASDGIHVVDKDGVLIEANDAFLNMLGYGSAAIGMLQIQDWDVQDSWAAIQERIGDLIARQGNQVFETRHRRSDGVILDVEINASGIEINGTGYLYASSRDITKRKQMEEELRQLAFYDTLTNLPNRRLLIERLKQTLLTTRRNNRYGALMFLDLDKFKILNDVYGHEMGDLLLIEVARRIGGCLRESDTIARFGGDEFVVMLSELDTDRATSVAQAEAIAEKIRLCLAEPYFLTLDKETQDVVHHCTSSIGIVLFNGFALTVNELVKAADSAMYQAKEDGRNLIRFHEPETQVDIAQT